MIKESKKVDASVKRGKKRRVAKSARSDSKSTGKRAIKKRTKEKKGSRKLRIRKLSYVISVEREIEKNGYIYGSIKELSEYFKIPRTTFYKIIQLRNFVFDKIKNGKNVYYFIMRRDMMRCFNNSKKTSVKRKRRGVGKGVGKEGSG